MNKPTILLTIAAAVFAVSPAFAEDKLRTVSASVEISGFEMDALGKSIVHSLLLEKIKEKASFEYADKGPNPIAVIAGGLIVGPVVLATAGGVNCNKTESSGFRKNSIFKCTLTLEEYPLDLAEQVKSRVKVNIY